MDTITDVFKCIICLNPLRDAHLCPHCSKMWCYTCIQRWLNSSTDPGAPSHRCCPHCRGALDEAALVRCRWADDVMDRLDDITRGTAPATPTDAAGSDFCAVHSSDLSVYCATCESCICHKCALFSEEHKGHVFRDIKDLYEMKVEMISVHLSTLREKQKELLKLMQDVEQRVESLRSARGEVVDSVKRHTEVVLAGIDTELQARLLALVRQKNTLTAQTQGLEGLLHEVEAVLRGKHRAGLIAAAGELLAKFAKIKDIAIPALPSDIDLTFTNELVPQYDTGEFRIRDFIALAKKSSQSDAIFSDAVYRSGLVWRLKVYPSGTQEHGTHMSVYLELIGAPRKAAALAHALFEWRIELLRTHTHAHATHAQAPSPAPVVREHACAFELGECWGYDKFFRLNLLGEQGFVNSDDGSILLRFSVRPSSYHQLAKINQMYIEQLEEEAAARASLQSGLQQRLAAVEAHVRRPDGAPADTSATTHTLPQQGQPSVASQPVGLASPEHTAPAGTGVLSPTSDSTARVGGASIPRTPSGRSRAELRAPSPASITRLISPELRHRDEEVPSSSTLTHRRSFRNAPSLESQSSTEPEPTLFSLPGSRADSLEGSTSDSTSVARRSTPVSMPSSSLRSRAPPSTTLPERDADSPRDREAPSTPSRTSPKVARTLFASLQHQPLQQQHQQHQQYSAADEYSYHTSSNLGGTGETAGRPRRSRQQGLSPSFDSSSHINELLAKQDIVSLRSQPLDTGAVTSSLSSLSSLPSSARSSFSRGGSAEL